MFVVLDDKRGRGDVLPLVSRYAGNLTGSVQAVNGTLVQRG